MSAKIEQNLELAFKTAFYMTLIVSGSYMGCMLARAQDLLPAPPSVPNLVMEPEYEAPKPKQKASEPEKDVKASEKLQFEPMTEEMPILEQKVSVPEIKDGSYYDEGTVLHVVSEPSISPKEEKIEEEEMPTEEAKEIKTPARAYR